MCHVLPSQISRHLLAWVIHRHGAMRGGLGKGGGLHASAGMGWRAEAEIARLKPLQVGIRQMGCSKVSSKMLHLPKPKDFACVELLGEGTDWQLQQHHNEQIKRRICCCLFSIQMRSE